MKARVELTEITICLLNKPPGKDKSDNYSKNYFTFAYLVTWVRR